MPDVVPDPVAPVAPVDDPLSSVDVDAEPWRPPPGGAWRHRLDAAADRVAGPERRWGRVVAGSLIGGGGVGAARAPRAPPPPPPPDDALPYTAGAQPAGAPPGARAPAGAPTSAPTTLVEAPLVVHAAGAVVVGGLHDLTPGARVADLLAAAGGPSPDADLDRLNLAAPLADGQRVWFPRVGEVTPPPVAAPDGGAPPAAGAAGPGEAGAPVNVNTATADELDALPGVGPSTAAAIIEHRERVGPFVVVEDLLQVSGIGDAKLAQMRDLVQL
ncbi:MAG: ComEA family DNA-binding protein [Acidimicrobiales bacterium]